MTKENEVKLKLIYNRLRDDNKVKSQVDFGKQVDFNSTSITHMIKGEKPLPFRMVKNLFNAFGVNANYVISDDELQPFYIGELMSVDVKEIKVREDILKARVESLTKEVQDLRQRLIDKEKIIGLLEKNKS